jgi:acetate kinase
MKVLVINCGSSTLKFQVFDVEGSEHGRRLAEGSVDRIGESGTIRLGIEGGEAKEERAQIDDHAEAARRVLKWVDSSGLLKPDGLGAVGHRVVHGGIQFIQPTVINDEVMDGIEKVSDFAPLHNGPSLDAIRAAQDTLGQSIPMVAVFDTAFHRTLPQRASEYAIPRELAEKHQIWRYGFHGIAHRYMMERYAELASKPLDEININTLQLGNGCSATAIRGGRSVDTSMGLTPLEGLVMGTRSGDVDPSLAGFLAQREGVSVDEVEDWLNRRSGLLGVSGRSKDMRELLEAEGQGDSMAALAVEMFCYRIRKYIGAYMAALDGADAIVFGGGIGENAPAVRTRICEGMDWCGLRLDLTRNADATGTEALISPDDAKVQAYVVAVDEEMIIARETVSRLRRML